MSPNEYLLKIVCLGSPSSNKTKILRGYSEGKFTTDYLPTLGVDITTKQIKIDDNQIKLIIVDTAGEKFFGKLRPSYYRGASGALIFFDHKKRKSFYSHPTSQLFTKKVEKLPNIWQKTKLGLKHFFYRFFPKKRIKLDEKKNKTFNKQEVRNNYTQSVIIQFYNEFRKYQPNSNIPIGLIGIQNGPESFQITINEAQDLANQLCIDYFAIKPRDSSDLEKIMMHLTRQVLENKGVSCT
ncbi:MAG: Rab family GTPase [Promethearchaeota archaeon]